MKQTPEVTQETAGKSEWVTPELSRMSVDQTFSGGRNVPAEMMSGRANVPGGGGS
ncbi:hypothetical protein M8009_03705 [Halomonas sp. ATCH28]|uniref:Uncharacterized protein n=1 Tax=Halomonas gemina TaxID=2945105 RepID=A0ABT0SZ48_9GAMM|nr:hypothetical protein [Halomonas gemina]MCL7939410.1 hypothetical protein [Halomonas gemina]